jgi:glycosyltransferase involved in cell wall biosynthesis
MSRIWPHAFAGSERDLYEVILADGGSKDDTVQIGRKLWSDITIIGQTRKRKGIALGCGFEEVTGDSIVMPDADGYT